MAGDGHGTGGDNPPHMGSAIECAHQYIFLRQEKINIGFERNPTYEYRDTYYCERCLKYKTVAVKRTRPTGRSFGEEFTEWTGHEPR